MAVKKESAEQLQLHPDVIYRPKDAMRFFGFKKSRFCELVASGALPRPIPLNDSGRAVGWLGQQIIDWQRQRIAAAERRQRASA